MTRSSPPSPTVYRAGVSSSNSYATAIGRDILAAGGNAFDAAVAMQAMLTVTEPFASGIGGFFVTIGYSVRDKQVFHLDATIEKPSILTEPPNTLVGGGAAAVPGTLAGMARLLADYGTMSLAQVFTPAIQRAREGWVLSAYSAARLSSAASSMSRFNTTTAIYFNSDGTPKREGQTVVNTDLANTLQLISDEGIDVFYKGAIAQDIVESLATSPFFPNANMTLEDLNLYEAVYRKPVNVSYGGYEVWGTLTPNNGGIFMGIGLKIIEKLIDFTQQEWGSTKSVVTILNTITLALTDTVAYAANQDWVDTPWIGLLSDSYIQQRSLMASNMTCLFNVTPGTPPGTPAYYRINRDASVPTSTTHFSVIDSMGNAVSITSTLGGFWGNQLVIKNRGFMLNNLTPLTIQPSEVGRKIRKTALSPYEYSLGAYRSSFHICPTLVMKDGMPYLVLGTPGSDYICGNVFTTLLNILGFKMNLKEAIEAPRYNTFNTAQWMFETEWFNNTQLMDDLRRVGAVPVQLNGLSAIGDINAVIRGTDGSVDAFADHRRDGRASLL